MYYFNLPAYLFNSFKLSDIGLTPTHPEYTLANRYLAPLLVPW